MNIENRKGSPITSAIAAGLFFIVLALFNKSMHLERDYSHQISSTYATSGSTMIVGSGSYQMYVIEEAKNQFMPIIANIH